MHDFITAILGISIGLCLGVTWTTYAISKACFLIKKEDVKGYWFVKETETKGVYQKIAAVDVILAGESDDE